MKLKNYLFLLLFLLSNSLFAQKSTSFFSEIENFKKADSLKKPIKGSILFVGSSSFRKWETIAQDFKGYKIINRGFGGSNLAQAIYYADDIIFPYAPKQVIIYSGENDLAEGATPDIILDRFKILFSLIRKNLPEVQISFISIKPSISREKLMPQIVTANQFVKIFLASQTNTSYIDVYNLMLLPNGKPMNDIFLTDNLHMNQKGYRIWVNQIMPYLIKSN